jgi:hypothetical protein
MGRSGEGRPNQVDLDGEVRRPAARNLARETPGQTLQATALVHEAYLRLVDHDQAAHWGSRGHFFAGAAEAFTKNLPHLQLAGRPRRIDGESAYVLLTESDPANVGRRGPKLGRHAAAAGEVIPGGVVDAGNALVFAEVGSQNRVRGRAATPSCAACYIE